MSCNQIVMYMFIVLAGVFSSSCTLTTSVPIDVTEVTILCHFDNGGVPFDITLYTIEENPRELPSFNTANKTEERFLLHVTSEPVEVVIKVFDNGRDHPHTRESINQIMKPIDYDWGTIPRGYVNGYKNEDGHIMYTLLKAWEV